MSASARGNTRKCWTNKKQVNGSANAVDDTAHPGTILGVTDPPVLPTCAESPNASLGIIIIEGVVNPHIVL